MSVALSVDSLKKTYGSFTAVNNLSFEVRKGEVFGLLGPNGAGKTTTLECIEGIKKFDKSREYSSLGITFY
ncbi:ATP-binding cassette domain-containing protein [Tissierella sp. MSJ-40]|uniref:ATP-binding cassette domain-containing protein n=1 Tax=Tissierella simiarum TaxID=2841534 RepID=A0ABS6E331_9FIRM|nr:ATP-binding cassette domain-containing protein [Tissierella simiarum]MBU5437315.1 ATP-binding cassette domain-containing protein [Tissierella simiarum]